MIVKYCDHPDGSGAKVYYADERKRAISDIRFRIRLDPEEMERFREAFAEAHPDLAAGRTPPHY
ncbi:MAG: hypothetical protein IKR86_09475 [Candidatus Methanomethylophilaceae archaeon]|nr:hypothetical protein [Thermoplasmata archaeon]MBR4226974.1 hypothetical protein [Candidatus Methanomethylophilaceae archaeon]